MIPYGMRVPVAVRHVANCFTLIENEKQTADNGTATLREREAYKKLQ